MNDTIIAARNRYRVEGDIVILTITQRNGNTHDITFDADDLDRVKRHVWRIQNARGLHYPATGQSPTARNYRESNPYTPLNYLIAGRPRANRVVFHLDGDWRNCRRSNVVHGSRSQALQHVGRDGSGFVSWHPKDRRWYAYGYASGRRVYLGGWPTKDEAVEARQSWQAKHDDELGDE